MRNHTDQPPPAGQLLEHVQGAQQRFLVQCAEALVDEQRVQPHASAPRLHHVGKAQRHGQRRQKRLPAGERAHVAHLASVAVQHVQCKPRLAAQPLLLLLAQAEPPVGHARKADVGRDDHAAEIVL